MDRLPETAAATNATIASQDNVSTKLQELATDSEALLMNLKHDEVPFDEKGQPVKYTAAAMEAELFHPPAINWTPSNEEDMAEKLFPADDAVVPSAGTAKATSNKEQATTTTTTSAVASPARGSTSKTAPSTPASSNKENNNTTTTPKREYKKKRSWLSLSPGLRRLKNSNKNKDKKLLLKESKEVEAIMASPDREATKTTGEFMKEVTKEAVVDVTKDAMTAMKNSKEEVVNLVKVPTENAVGDLLELAELAPTNTNNNNNNNNNNTNITAPAFSEAIEQMNSPPKDSLKEQLDVKEQVAEQVKHLLDEEMGEDSNSVKDTNQDIFRKKEVTEGAVRKFPSAFDIASTVVTDLNGTSENERDALQSAFLSAMDTAAAAVASDELALEEDDVKTVVTSGASKTESLVTTVAEGIADVKAAEERNLTRSISMDEDDYDCVALDQCVLDTVTAEAAEADKLGDQTEKATNLTTSKSMSASETSTDSKDEDSKKKKWWKRPLKSLSPKRNRKSSKNSTPEPSSAPVDLDAEGGAARASVAHEDESEAFVTAEIHREFVEATAKNYAEGSKFASFEKNVFEPPASIKEVPSPTRKSLDWEEIVAHSEARDADMRVGRILVSFQLLLGAIVGALFFSTTPSAVLLRNAACAPLSPWSELSGAQESYSIFTAPWWIPAPLDSDQVHNLVCGGERAHTKVEWMFEKESKTDKLYRMVVSEMGGYVLLDKKNLVSASFSQEGILVTNKKGKQEASPAPWNL